MRRYTTNLAGMLLLFGLGGGAIAAEEFGPPLPGTKPLTMGGDIASELVAGVEPVPAEGDRRVDRQAIGILEARSLVRPCVRGLGRAEPEAAGPYPGGERSAGRGRRDPSSGRRVRPIRPKWTVKSRYPIGIVSWPAFGDVTGEGLELGAGDVCVIVVPDADQTPEQLAGLVPGVPAESQVGRRLAESHCRVFIPALIDRTMASRNGRARLTNREFVYRPAFELGRHVIGYEVQKVLALVDALEREGRDRGRGVRVGIFGHGEGGAIALYAAALDPRIEVRVRQRVFRRSQRHMATAGGSERLRPAGAVRRRRGRLADRTAGLDRRGVRGPGFVIPPGTGGAPGRLTTPALGTVRAEVERARTLSAGLDPAPRLELVASGADGMGPFGTDEALEKLLRAIDPAARLEPAGPATAADRPDPKIVARLVEAGRVRQARQLHELDRHNQQLLVESPFVREAYMKKLDTRSADAYAASVEPYRASFAEEIIGRFDLKPLPPDVRSRRIYDEPGFTGYEVVMDVFPDVIAYGILLLPKGIKEGERRPVVVCQHGLEGRPRDVADPKVDNPAYHRYAARLAERGFITFAPQNLYIFEDRFRTLQRKANPIKKTLFSVIVPQHQQITDWLKTLPFVDPSRIAFYGLSYGGKSAMRIPPLVKNYCLSICSADFNEWVWKNASTRSPYSYVWSGEYEIFEFDLGSTFNYAEMAALIAPRPFMVERGHFDGVAPDEAVAYEFAKVYRLYDAKLGIGDRCRIEFFVGPHTINGQGTFEFLHRHLRWPGPGEKRAAGG